MCLAHRLVLNIVTLTSGGVLPIIFYSLMFIKSKYLSKKVTAAIISDTLADESYRRARNTYLFLFVALIGCSVPNIAGLLVKQFAQPLLYNSYSGLSVMFLYTVVILDPLVIMKHQDVKRCALKPLQAVNKQLQRLLPTTAVHPSQ